MQLVCLLLIVVRCVVSLCVVDSEQCAVSLFVVDSGYCAVSLFVVDSEQCGLCLGVIAIGVMCRVLACC